MAQDEEIEKMLNEIKPAIIKTMTDKMFEEMKKDLDVPEEAHEFAKMLIERKVTEDVNKMISKGKAEANLKLGQGDETHSVIVNDNTRDLLVTLSVLNPGDSIIITCDERINDHSASLGIKMSDEVLLRKMAKIAELEEGG